MRTQCFEVYTFEELPKETQDKAIDRLRDINLDYEWWDGIYDDAERIGLTITEFDLDRRRYAKATWKSGWTPYQSALAIIAEHGQSCDTYQTAKDFLITLHESKQRGKWSEEQEDIEADFLQSLTEDYSIMLQREYEYLGSDEAVKETILCNEYEFYEDGSLV